MKYAIIAILVSAFVTICMRALPFIIYSGDRKMPAWMEQLGRRLPCAIMAVLVIYCLTDLKTDFFHSGIPELISVVLVVLTYKWKHNTLLSIVAGTICNMILIRLL